MTSLLSPRGDPTVMGRAVHAATMGVLLLSCGIPSPSFAQDDSRPPADEIDAAITRSLALIEQSAVEYRRNRECFSCHHQAMPVLTLHEAQRRGFTIDQINLEQQLDHTAAHLQRGKQRYLDGQGQGGRADTAGWALWTLETGGRSPNDVTEAVTEFLLSWDQDLGHWRPPSNRPPTESSDFTSTYVAIRGLYAFAAPEQQERVAQRTEAARNWLLEAEAQDTEDAVFRLRALSYLGVERKEIQAAAQQLIGLQRSDGAWGQTPEMESDAYATATALVALHQSGELPVDDEIYQQGVAWLVRSQLEDGSWKVTSRSEPIQVYFESGFPHGKDQFLSMAATSWAAKALLLTRPTTPP